MYRLPEILEFIRTLRAEGATEVAVGDVAVKFGEPSHPTFSEDDALPEDDFPEDDVIEAEEPSSPDDLLYWSADG